MLQKRKKNSALSRLDRKIAASAERAEELTGARDNDVAVQTDATPDATFIPIKEEPSHVSSSPAASPVSPKKKPLDYAVYEQELEATETLERRKEQRVFRRQQMLRRITVIALIVGCTYLLFLIYGAINTSYEYEDGQVRPQRMTFESLSALEDFNMVSAEYRQARTIYEAVLRLDYRLGAGVEEPLVIAPEYEMLLEQIESLTLKIQAKTVSAQYKQTHAMLLAWVKNDAAIYCQRMSASISQDNPEYAAQALQVRTIMYNDFNLITTNLLTLAQSIDGASYDDIASWSPEKYIRDEYGAVPEQQQ